MYRGRQLGLDRQIALKVPTHEIAADPIMARRFAREARSAAKVQHPGVVAIYAVGELADGRPYLAMQFVEGQPLDKILVDGPIAAVRALRIVRSIASALSETHASEVVHRDLKPSNIMWRLDRNGDDRITLVDFGIALAKPGNADATRLTSGGLIGTPHYMSPEQAHGDQVDARADLYALGCVLYELVTAHVPFDGSGFEVLLAHLGRPAPVPSQANPAVPKAIDRLCAHLLAKKPEDRPPSADVLVTMLDEALEELDGGRSKAAANSDRSNRARRKTLATRRDLPQGAPSNLPSKRRARRLMVGGAVFGLVLATAGSAALQLRDQHGELVDTPNGPVNPNGAHRRAVFKDDGEIVIHALVPDPIVANREIRPHLEIKNKLGQPIVAEEVVVTITDEAGGTKGIVALPHDKDKGHYDFHYTFDKPGHYALRVFPPSVDSQFEIPLDVAP